MMVSNKGQITGLLRWQKTKVVAFIIPAVIVCLVHETIGLQGFELPALPMAVVGGAVGIFVSFRTNSAYDRWWEGRKLWGRLINQSRHWASQVAAYVPEPRDQDRLIRRHIAYVHLLRLLLRQTPPPADPVLQSYLEDPERDGVHGASNGTHHLLRTQLNAVTALANAGVVDPFRLQSFDETLRQFLDIQGGCERIKKTPLPRGYGYIAETLILCYSILFPLALVHETGWFTVPLNVLVCLAFALISEAGRVLEDPFNEFWNALPLTALSNTIERDLLSTLGVTELPVPTAVDENGILM